MVRVGGGGLLGGGRFGAGCQSSFANHHELTFVVLFYFLGYFINLLIYFQLLRLTVIFTVQISVADSFAGSERERESERGTLHAESFLGFRVSFWPCEQLLDFVAVGVVWSLGGGRVV